MKQKIPYILVKGIVFFGGTEPCMLFLTLVLYFVYNILKIVEPTKSRYENVSHHFIYILSLRDICLKHLQSFG